RARARVCSYGGRLRPRRGTPPHRCRPRRGRPGGRGRRRTQPRPPRRPYRQWPPRRASVPARSSPQVTALDDRRELLRFRHCPLEPAVAVGELVLQAVTGPLVAKPLDADALELRLELLHASLARSHLTAELLHLPAQLLKPHRLGVEQPEDALERPAPNRRGGRGARSHVVAVRSDGDRRGVEQGGERRGRDHADLDAAGEMLANPRDSLGGRVGKDNADVAVIAADRSGADARKLLAANPLGRLAVDHEGVVLQVPELPAPGRLQRSRALVPRLEALLVAVDRVALEIVVQNSLQFAYRRSYRLRSSRSLGAEGLRPAPDRRRRRRPEACAHSARPRTGSAPRGWAWRARRCRPAAEGFRSAAGARNRSGPGQRGSSPPARNRSQGRPLRRASARSRPRRRNRWARQSPRAARGAAPRPP